MRRLTNEQLGRLWVYYLQLRNVHGIEASAIPNRINAHLARKGLTPERRIQLLQRFWNKPV